MTRSLALACFFVAALSRAAGVSVAFTLTDTKGAPVPDAVVSLVPLDAPAKFTPPATPLEIVQRGKEFLPFVTPLVVGSTVSFLNRDVVEHQVYSLSDPKKFELPLYKPGKVGTVVFDRPGVVIIGCNIHDWMLAYLVVLETPLFAQTAAAGTATIADAAPGRYRAEVWHPRLAKSETREVTLLAGAPPATLAFTLALKPDRRIHRAAGATGGGYK